VYILVKVVTQVIQSLLGYNDSVGFFDSINISKCQLMCEIFIDEEVLREVHLKDYECMCVLNNHEDVEP
jgi:hypothetical protein